VRGAPSPARYAGSLLQLDFGERDQQKSVTIVDASVGKPSAMREVELTAGRRLLDIRGTLEEVAGNADDVGDAFLRVFVKTEGPVPGLADRVREILPNAVHVEADYERVELAPNSAPLSSLTPLDQFLAYYRHVHGAEADDELVETFDEVLAAVRGAVE
jgi:exonuclease SbcD